MRKFAGHTIGMVAFVVNMAFMVSCSRDSAPTIDHPVSALETRGSVLREQAIQREANGSISREQAIHIAKDEAAKWGWDENTESEATREGSGWVVYLSRVPATPGAHCTIEVSSDGKIGEVLRGK